MKRLIAILLALTLVFALASCGKKAENTINLEPYTSAIANTSLKNATVEITQTNDFLPDYPLVARYEITYNNDGSATVNYTYMEYVEIGEDSDSITNTISGYATISADGTVSGNISATVTAAASVNFNLDASKMAASEDHGILRANISAANTAAVLGGAIGADVVFTLSTANNTVTGATINYTLDGAAYEIVCTYNG